ncbi:four-carbon acid sugar kinase family protein [Brooklawnia cerclae]
MPPHLGIVADDVTGATTVAALLAHAGVSNAVLLDPSYCQGDEGSGYDAVVVSTDSRALLPEEARVRVAAATRSLLEAGATLFSKRTDTTSRGGIGYEVEGMLSQLDEDYVAVLVPAMPQSKRIVVGGYSLIDSVMLEFTGVATDVRTPVHESHLPTLIGSQLTQELEHISICDVLGGEQSLIRRFTEARSQGCRVFLADAASLADVELIARVLVGLGWKVVCVDPGPFTQAFALASGITTHAKVDKPPLRTEPQPYERGTAVVVVGSATAVTNTQMRSLLDQEGSVALSVRIAPLVCGGQRLREESERVLAELDRSWDESRPPRVVVVGLESSLTGCLVDIDRIETEAGIERGVGAANVAARLGQIGREVIDRIGGARLAGTYFTGGDVMVNTCHAMEAKGLSLEGYVIPQADQGRIVGGPFAGLPVVGKGGLTGGPLTAIHIVNRLFDERKVS